MASKKEESIDFSSMNLYKKLQSARAELSTIDFKKSGQAKNKTGQVMYTYFELSDILPYITNACNKYGITPIYNFTKTGATLELRNNDNLDELIVTSMPVEITQLLMCNAMQSMGGAKSFAKRYLYFDAFEISENMDEGGEIFVQQEKISNVQVKVIKKLIDETNTDEMQFMAWANIERIEDMTVDKLHSAMNLLEKKKEKMEVNNE